MKTDILLITNYFKPLINLNFMSKIIKTLALTTGIAAISAPCFAQTCNQAQSCGSLTTIIAVVSAVVAVCALFLAALMRREHKREIINLTAEFQNMLENTQTTINKDIRNLRREVGRLRGGDSNKSNDEKEPRGEGENRRNNNRRRQYRRPSRNEGDDNAAQSTETEE